MGRSKPSANDKDSRLSDDERRAARYRDISEIISEFYCAVRIAADGSTSLEWIEGPFEEIAGTDRAKIRSLDDWIARLHPDDAPAFSRAFHTALSGAPAMVEFRLESNAGKERWLQSRLHPVGEANGTQAQRVICAVRDITEPKSAELALQTIEKRLELAMEGAEIGYWDHYFNTGTIIRSGNWTRMLGYSVDEIKPDLMSWKDLIHPDDLPSVEQIAADHEAGRIPFFKAAHRLRTKSGEWKWVLNWGKIIERDNKGRPLRATGIHLDLTELKQAETALRESEERYRAVVQQSRDAIFLVDMDTRRVLDCNAALAGFLGYDREAIRAMTLYDFIDHPREDIDRKLETIEARGGADLGERRYRHRNGSRIIVEVGATAISCNGKKIICVVSRDVTARKRVEEEEKERAIHVQEAQRLESLGLLAGGIAHEFNNILVGILGNASLALDEIAPHSPVRELIEQIESSGRRAADLSKQLLAYAGKGSVLKQDVNLSEIVNDNLALLESSISRKARLTLDLAKSAPVADADAVQLRQVAVNLLTNASDSLEDRVGDITVSTGVITLSRSYLRGILLGKDLPDGNYAYLKVTDTGCGIDGEVVSRIFDPYFSTKFSGRGLGLAVVIGIVKAHLGAIDIESEPGKGTTLTVILPAGRDSVSRNIGDEGQVRPWKGTGNALVVDDEKIVIDLATNMLRTLGFSVVTARNGREGIDLFRERPAGFAFVLLDMTMPEMDGETAFRELRAIDPEARIVVTSGFSAHMCSIPFAGDRRIAFLEKPYTLETMTDRVRSILAAR